MGRSPKRDNLPFLTAKWLSPRPYEWKWFCRWATVAEYCWHNRSEIYTSALCNRFLFRNQIRVINSDQMNCKTTTIVRQHVNVNYFAILGAGSAAVEQNKKCGEGGLKVKLAIPFLSARLSIHLLCSFTFNKLIAPLWWSHKRWYDCSLWRDCYYWNLCRPL